MGRILEFKWMYADEVKSHVWADRVNGKVIVDCIDYDDRPIYNFQGKRPKTPESIINKMRQRCFEEARPDVQELLEMIGLRQYSPLDICIKTKGQLCGDRFWIDWIVAPEIKNSL